MLKRAVIDVQIMKIELRSFSKIILRALAEIWLIPGVKIKRI